MNSSSFSLQELNIQVKESIKHAFSSPVWIRAEISELHENATGHGYFELIEKDEDTDNLLAKGKANCWASTFRMLKPYFESTTGEQLKVGLKILVLCSVEFHELYGISLNIKDIDPSYTLGDMALKRLETIKLLKEDGVFNMNKEIPLSKTPQRIAVISSETAAGYGDFIDQLMNNAEGFSFYTKLFPSIMQGEQSVDSIIKALDLVYSHQEKFDAVVIIRGGGATADLSTFDNYDLAFNCTQFPLPIITGIGHQRDESILDLVAHTAAKTPTAVAEFLLFCMNDTSQYLLDMQATIINFVEGKLQQETNRLHQLSVQFPAIVNEIVYKQKLKISLQGQGIKNAALSLLKEKRTDVLMKEKELILSSPEVLLSKGYSLTSKNNKIVKSITQLKKGDKITTQLKDGDVQSIVE